jgi:chorismate-pyruvate lyase
MTVADRLAELHFTAQLEASTDLDVVDIVHLDPFLRGLLFTDGTVSRALEAHTLLPVKVETVDQAQAPVPARVARYLDVDRADECVRRRIVMKIDGTTRSVWAESYVAPHRLPEDFVGSLGASSQGIGGSLQRLRLESWRELLWFGLGSAPPWSGTTPDTTTLTRTYRIITQGRPALLISEAFVVELHAGVYRLVDSGVSASDQGSAAARSRLRRPLVVAGNRAPGGGDAAAPTSS